MTDTPPGLPQPPTGGSQVQDVSNLRTTAMIGYVLFLLACVNGLTAIIGVIIAYLRRSDAAGTVWQSHFANMILVFWVMVAAMLVALFSWPLSFGWWLGSDYTIIWPPSFAFPLLFGLIALPILAVWYLYRVIRGLIRAGEDKPY